MSESTRTLFNVKTERYLIQERLGSGGMARVYKGFDKVLERQVAIKVLHEHLADDPLFLERFTREARFVAGFNHPNIVQVYDFGMLEHNNEHILYMVMSYIPGKTLRDTLIACEGTPCIDRGRALRIMLDLLDALGYAHERGMIHRDVKPANILFDESGRAILTDFGIARMTEHSQLTQEGLTVGTPAYMAPEQATGDMVDARSDLYAVGVILYELLTGKPPFEDDGSISVLLKHLNDPVPPLSKHIHVENSYLDAVVTKALAKLPHERYESAAAFADDLKKAFAGEIPRATTTQLMVTVEKPEPIPERATTLTMVLPYPVRRVVSRSPLGILGVGLVLIAFIVGVSLFNGQDTAANIPEDTDNVIPENVEAMVGQPIFFASDFTTDEVYSEYWPQGLMAGLDREFTPEGFYQIDSTLSGRAIATVFQNNEVYGNHALRISGVLQEDSSTSSAFGIVFRYVDDANYNVFAVDGLGRFSIWVRQDGIWRELRNAGENWTRSPMVNPLGEMNTLMVNISEDTLTGFVNGEMVTQVMDSTIAEGGVGIYVASPENGSVMALIDMFEVLPSPEELLSSVESMTGNTDATDEDDTN
ncbi:MAG: hypothetical protein OHK0046_06510 [Anaerolineae bacterium]